MDHDERAEHQARDDHAARGQGFPAGPPRVPLQGVLDGSRLLLVEESHVDRGEDVEDEDSQQSDLEGVDQPPVQQVFEEVCIPVEGRRTDEQGQVPQQVHDHEAEQGQPRDARDELLAHGGPGNRAE